MTERVIIVIQPTAENALYCHLVKGQALFTKSAEDKKLDRVLLPLIDHVLKQKKVSASSIYAIGLAQSPMSLASQRLAVSVVNSLGWAWGVKTFVFTGVVSLESIQKSVKKSKKGFLKAEYSSAPRIGSGVRR